MEQVKLNFNDGSQHTAHHTLLRMGLRNHSPIRVPMMTHVNRQKHQQWERKSRNWTLEQWKEVAWSDESHFLLHHMCAVYLGK